MHGQVKQYTTTESTKYYDGVNKTFADKLMSQLDMILLKWQKWFELKISGQLMLRFLNLIDI